MFRSTHQGGGWKCWLLCRAWRLLFLVRLILNWDQRSQIRTNKHQMYMVQLVYRTSVERVGNKIHFHIVALLTAHPLKLGMCRCELTWMTSTAHNGTLNFKDLGKKSAILEYFIFSFMCIYKNHLPYLSSGSIAIHVKYSFILHGVLKFPRFILTIWSLQYHELCFPLQQLICNLNQSNQVSHQSNEICDINELSKIKSLGIAHTVEITKWHSCTTPKLIPLYTKF
jgi:hypothetical protein